MSYTEPVTLGGDHVTLTPLALADHDGLVAAARDGELWRLSYTSVPTPEAVSADIDAKLALWAAGTMLPFVVRRLAPRAAAGGEIVGRTTYCNIDERNRHLEIGHTWYAAAAQRSGVNTETKLLLLTHAFETLDCVRVELRTHALNRRSRTAIERLGASLEGVFRQHVLMPDGSWRNTCVYAIVAHEWPAVKAELRRRLDEAAATGTCA